MNIEDIEIKIKKYDRTKNYVLVNLLLFKELEIRGYVVRFTKTKNTTTPIWLVTPPSVPIGRGKYRKYFWITEFKDADFWEKLQQRIIHLAISHTNLS